MNLSEALNFAVKKIVEQGGRCLVTNEVNSSCAYASGSKHCAVGWLLDHNNPEMMRFEGTVQELIEVFEDKIPEVISKNPDEFSELQMFHDVSEKEKRRERLKLLKMYAPDVDYSGDHWETWINMGE